MDARRLLNDVRLPSVTLREDATDEQLDAAIDTLVGVMAGDGPAFPARTAGDFNQDGVWTAADIDALIDAISEPTPDLTFDIDESGELDLRDLDSLVQDVYLTWYGDANLNGGFGTDDLVLVFQVGKYESGRQATWSEGDWDGDRRFTSSDFVHAFRDTGYCPGPRPSVPEPGSVALLAPTIFLAIGLRRSLLRGMQSPGGSVPEPSSLTLLLIGLLAIRRRK